ncbi:MAG: CysS/YqeB C-terminal domain-containing protein [Anaerolineales bacterium]
MTLGQIAFLGSGETSLAGGRIFEMLARALPQPLRIAILETPAGFELNSHQVAGKVADFLKGRLQNYTPIVDVIPARKRGTPFSPDEAAVLRPLLHANLIFMGPGSPTYATRQLQGSLAWDIIRARHRLGATLAFASAATISIGAWALPVYEIYKVGEEVHTKTGLNLFADYGMQLSFIPHWNNADGGEDLDTSRCFIGMERFDQWCKSLPPENTTVGLDEHTGIIVDFETGQCEIVGVSSVSLVQDCKSKIYPAGVKFPLRELGEFIAPDPLEKDVRPDVWGNVVNAPPLEEDQPSEEVLVLLEKRRDARSNKHWAESDQLRDQIGALGWTVQDTKDGQKLVKG